MKANTFPKRLYAGWYGVRKDEMVLVPDSVLKNHASPNALKRRHRIGVYKLVGLVPAPVKP